MSNQVVSPLSLEERHKLHNGGYLDELPEWVQEIVQRYEATVESVKEVALDAGGSVQTLVEVCKQKNDQLVDYRRWNDLLLGHADALHTSLLNFISAVIDGIPISDPVFDIATESAAEYEKDRWPQTC